MKLRLLSLIICIMIFFSSCSGDVLDPIVTMPAEEFPTSELTEAASSISLAGYKVIRSDKASAATVSAAMELKKALDAVVDGISIGDDWYNKNTSELPAEALEILVGDTNRPESTSLKETLLVDDFAIKYFPESRRLAIIGGDDDSTMKAIAHFLEYCLVGGEIASDLSYLSAGQYAVTSCLLNGAAIEDYALVIPDNADADENYAAELITNRILEKTGKKLVTVKLSKASDGKKILIGRAADASIADSEYICGTKNGNVILCGDGGLVVRAARDLLEGLFPKGETEVSLTLGEAKTIKFERASYPALADFGTKPIALADQLNASLAVYDLSSGEALLKYEFKPKTSKGFSLKGYGNRIDEARLRYSEKWGAYIMLITSSSGYCAVASYPAEECLWEAELAGTSPHSIEYLPNGMIAIAASGGNDTDKGFIRIYSAESKKDGKYAEKRLTSAHAVLWDETREVLWAMGSTEIVAYEIGSDPSSPSMTKIASYGCNDMKGGHDLSAISGDDDRVWVGGNFVGVFDKTTGKIDKSFAGSAQISTSSVKCICSFPDGTSALTVATDVYASHDTDRFKLFTVDGKSATAATYTFDGRAFYKARAFLADYN